MSDNNQATTVSLFGCLPFVLGCILLASIGACGASCQASVLDGIRSTVRAVQGQQ